MEISRLSYEFTRVLSPIDGQISRYYLTLGNLVNQDQTLLTTVVSVDPMYVYFEMDEPTLLRTRKAVNEGKIKALDKSMKIAVSMALQGEDGFPHQGTINFVNNQVNPTTGSILVRGVFPNPLPKGGRRLLSPGMFVKIRLPIGQPHPALLVIDRAVGSDQGLKFVYVVDAENKAQYRRVTTGAPQDDGLRVIEQGLKPDDWVVFGGLQQVRPRMTVRPERADARDSRTNPRRHRRSGESKKVAKAEPPTVPVSQPVRREVTNYVDFTGRTEAVHSVDIRPRVSGYLVKMPFQEGEEVKAGDLLFVIDRRPYKAQLDQAQGQVDLYQASLKLARTTLVRDRAINMLKPGSVSQQQFDQEQAVVEEAEARVDAYKKSMEISKLSHEFTRVISPIDGQISRYYLTSRQPGQPGPDPPDHGGVGRPDVRLLRDGRAHALAHPQGGQRGQDQAARQGYQNPSLHGATGGGRVSSSRDDQFREQPGQPHHRQHPGARGLSQPPAQGGPPAVIAGHVRQGPAADRPTLSGTAGHRSRRRVGRRGSSTSSCLTTRTRPRLAMSRPGRCRTTGCASSSMG